MKDFTADTDYITCLDGRSVIGKDITKMTVCHLVIAISYYLIGTMYGICTNTGNSATGYGRQQVSRCIEINSMMEKLDTCMWMFLITITKYHLYLFVALLKGHAIARGRL